MPFQGIPEPPGDTAAVVLGGRRGLYAATEETNRQQASDEIN